MCKVREDSKEALVDSRAAACKEPWTWSCLLEKSCLRVLPQPNACGLIPWVSRVHLSCSRASLILTNTPNQSFWNNFFFFKSLIFKFKRKRLNYSKWAKSQLCWTSLASFCNLVFRKSQIARGEHCNKISILKIYEGLKPVLLSWPLGRSQLHSENRQLMGLLQGPTALA